MSKSLPYLDLVHIFSLSLRMMFLLKMLDPWKESYDQPRQDIKKHRHYCANKSLSCQGYDFSSGHV